MQKVKLWPTIKNILQCNHVWLDIKVKSKNKINPVLSFTLWQRTFKLDEAAKTRSQLYTWHLTTDQNLKKFKTAAQKSKTFFFFFK